MNGLDGVSRSEVLVVGTGALQTRPSIGANSEIL